MQEGRAERCMRGVMQEGKAEQCMRGLMQEGMAETPKNQVQVLMLPKAGTD